MAFERLFTVRLPFGVCVGVALPEVAYGDQAGFELPAELHPAEAAFARTLANVRRAGWVGGRVALRAALADAAVAREAPEPILATARGAPILPAGAVGSVSHKRAVAVALAARACEPPATVGIDVEELRPLRVDVARRVMTPDERAALPDGGPARDAAVLLGFSAKEAIYKALDPWVQRFVGFEEAIVERTSGGAFTARLALIKGEGPFAAALADGRAAGAAVENGPGVVGDPLDGLILVAARVSRASS